MEPEETLIFSSWTLAAQKYSGGDLDVEKLTALSEKYVEEVVEGDGFFPDGARYTIKVLPGVGVFGGKDRVWSFRGGLAYYYLGAYYEVYSQLKDFESVSGSHYENVVLDITHGINYMPVLLREAVELALRHYSAVSGRKLTFYVVNSDPVLVENQESHIRLVDRRSIVPRESSAWLESELSIFDPRQSGGKVYKEYIRGREDVTPQYKEIKDRLKTLYEEYYKTTGNIINVLNHGALLYIAQYMREDIERLGEGLSEVEEVFRLYMDREGQILRINMGEDSVTVEVVLEPVKWFGALHAMMDLLYSSYRGVAPKSAEWVELDNLKKIAEKLSFSEYVSTIFTTELDNIKKRVKTFAEKCKKDLRKGLLYMEIYDRTRFEGGRVVPECDANVGKPAKPDTRNFIAHGGMEKNILKVKYENEKVFLSYTDKNIVDEVLKQIKK